MDRSFWISLVALGLGIAVLLTGRAAMDGVTYFEGVSLAAEIERLDGTPSSQDLADRTTEAAGCIYGDRPRVRTCWYAWAHPERPQYLAAIAERVQADSGGSALGYLAGAGPFWLLALFAAWKSTRPRPKIGPGLMPPPPRAEPPVEGRLVR